MDTQLHHFIDDNIKYPLVTKSYRILVVSTVLCVVCTAIAGHRSRGAFYALDTLFYAVLFMDFLIRFIGTVNGKYFRKDRFGKNSYISLKGYIFSFYGAVDLLSAMLFPMRVAGLHMHDMELVLSLLSFLKLARYTPALVILKDVFISERKTLFASLYVMLILTISTSAILYFVERDVNVGFDTILKSIWWSVITLSTVGYGDIIPQTVPGKILGGLAAISGFGMFALPAGILANGFAIEVKRLKEIVSWNMVAKVPLFSSLESGAIYDIASLLRVRRYKKHEIIIKEGSRGESMYFIVEGSVEVYKEELVGILKEGEFFGEISLLKNIPRTATIIARQRCELLELNRYDFHNLTKEKPEILEGIMEVAAKRGEDLSRKAQ